MFKKFLLISVLLLSSFITIFPSKKENTNFFDYCYSLEKIISRNTVEKSKNLSKNFKPLVKDISLFGTNKSKGTFAHELIDQYKNSKKLFIISFVPNQIYCLAGYWIEEISPGKFESIFYEKTKQKINEYKNTKKEVDKFIKEINLEYKSIQKEINNFFR
ncbi:MAG: carbon storage regulator CsrA [Prochlorococcus marinus CUG1436]|nr:carbon storage regulator CsrA [Prochlorococcus marinus CUG1436]